MLLPCHTLGPDPTELAALHGRAAQRGILAACHFLEAIDRHRPVPILSRLWTRIAHLDAELRRN